MRDTLIYLTKQQYHNGTDYKSILHWAIKTIQPIHQRNNLTLSGPLQSFNVKSIS